MYVPCHVLRAGHGHDPQHPLRLRRHRSSVDRGLVLRPVSAQPGREPDAPGCLCRRCPRPMVQPVSCRDAVRAAALSGVRRSARGIKCCARASRVPPAGLCSWPPRPLWRGRRAFHGQWRRWDTPPVCAAGRLSFCGGSDGRARCRQRSQGGQWQRCWSGRGRQAAARRNCRPRCCGWWHGRARRSRPRSRQRWERQARSSCGQCRLQREPCSWT
jgi:hypothetical protein